MPPLIDLSGQRFGRLVAVHRSGPPAKGRGSIWRCHCDCGNVTNVPINYLHNGNTRSCGCLWREAFDRTIHGHARKGRITPERYIWNAMKERCSNPNNRAFANYGGRGITVCEAWRHDFTAFLRDMGLRPSSQHSLDRFPDNDGNYEPGNVRWATRLEQNRNRRSTRILEHNGECKALAAWAEEVGIPANTIQRRLQLGWPVDRALHQPIQHHKT